MNYINLIPWGISLVSVIVAIMTYSRNGKKEDITDVKQEESKLNGIRESLIKANVKLDTVCNTTTETRSDIKAMNKDLISIDRRVTGLERDMKTVFNAIDELKGRNE